MSRVELVHWNPVRPRARRWPLRGTVQAPVNNFGDLLGPLIVQKLLARRGLSPDAGTEHRRLLTVGSILHFAQDDDVVWGTGVNGKVDPAEHRFTRLDVRSVRGPLTREFLQQRSITVPEAYGDPGLLVGELWPELRASRRPRGPRSVLMNLNDRAGKGSAALRYPRGTRVISPTSPVESVLQRIAGSSLVVGSSLHAIIVAEALGIPARAVASAVESPFKYRDYYAGTGREIEIAGSIEEALELGGAEAPDIDVEAMLESFPWELWSDGTVATSRVPRSRSAEETRAGTERPTLYAFPWYPDNPWQSMLYSAGDGSGFTVSSCRGLDDVPSVDRVRAGDVLHVNWTAEVSQRADSVEESASRVNAFVERLRELQGAGVRVLWTIHNVLPHDCRYLEPELRLCRALAELSDSIMVMNPDTSREVESYYSLPTARVWQLPHPSYLGVAAPALERSDAERRLGIPSDRFVLVFFGLIRPYKGVTDLLAEFRREAAMLDECVLVIAGEPSGSGVIEELKSQVPEDGRVIVRPWRQSDEDTSALFSAADLVVLPYRAGLNSGVAAMAASFGVPVAAHAPIVSADMVESGWGVEIPREDPDGTAWLRELVDWRQAHPEAGAAALRWAEARRPHEISQRFAQHVRTLSDGGVTPPEQ